MSILIPIAAIAVVFLAVYWLLRKCQKTSNRNSNPDQPSQNVSGGSHSSGY